MTDELDRLNPSRSAAKLGDRTAAVGTATGVVTGQTRSKRARHLNWKTSKDTGKDRVFGFVFVFFSLHKKGFTSSSKCYILVNVSKYKITSSDI